MDSAEGEPVLTSFSVSEFQRERDVIAYCFRILEAMGGDTGPKLTTLSNILHRIMLKTKEGK